MNWADIFIVGLIGLSVLVGFLRGFVREALSLITWVVAIWVGLRFSEKLAGLFAPYLEVPSVRVALSFGLLFIAVLILGAVVGYLAGELVERTGVSGTDRIVGVVFGLARGVAIVSLLVLLAGLTVLPKDPWWKGSLLIGHFQPLALWLRDFLPADIASHFIYD